MKTDNYWLRRQEASVSRRRFLGGSALATGGLGAGLLVGCGGDDAGSGDSGTP